MSISAKTLTALLISAGTFLTIIAGYIFLTISYERAYEKIHFGQSQSEIAGSMGFFFSKRKCYSEIFDFNKVYLGKCAEVYRYSIPYQQWEVAFDEDRQVIEKYNVFLGEYGDRAPE